MSGAVAKANDEAALKLPGAAVQVQQLTDELDEARAELEQSAGLLRCLTGNMRELKNLVGTLMMDRNTRTAELGSAVTERDTARGAVQTVTAERDSDRTEPQMLRQQAELFDGARRGVESTDARLRRDMPDMNRRFMPCMSDGVAVARGIGNVVM